MIQMRSALGWLTTKLAGVTVLTALFALPTHAANVYVPAKAGEVMSLDEARAVGKGSFQPATELYRAGEFQLDLFGAASFQELTVDALKNHNAGAGLGINYFFSKHIGIGYEARHVFSSDENFLNQMAAHLFIRFPIGHVSPYVFAGAGFRYQDNTISPRYHVGAGLEVRLHPNVGVFTDLRFVQKDLQFNAFADQGYVGRVGVRLSF